LASGFLLSPVILGPTPLFLTLIPTMRLLSSAMKAGITADSFEKSGKKYAHYIEIKVN